MTVESLVLEVMWDTSTLTTAFDDQFTSLANWTVEAGSTFTVASNLVSNAAGSGNRMSAGDSGWNDISTGTRIRFKWVTGGTFYWMLRYVDASNYVYFWADGANFRLYKVIAGAAAVQVATVAAVLTNTNFYWIQPIVSGTQWSATLNNDSAGAPGSVVATMTAQTISDSAVQLGKMAVQMDGGTGMQMGGNFADVCFVKTPTWTDETAQLISATWKRGRDYASQLTGRSTAGSLDVLLDNPSGRYAPLNTAGALYGKLLPGRKVRVRVTSPTAVIAWQGYLDDILPSPSSRDSAPRAMLHASGPLKYIAGKRASTAMYTSVLTGTAIGYILDDAGWATGDRVLDAGQITMNRWKADGDFCLSHLQEIEEMELGYIGESKDGKIVWEDANHRLTLTTSQATFSDNSGASLPYEDITELDPWRDIYNIATADVQLYTVQSLAVLWSMTGETPSINPSATKDFWARYPTPDAAAQADSVDAWTTPVITTDYLANTQADGLGTNKSAAQTVVVSKFANAMKISITNTDAGAVFITFLQARGTAVYKNDLIRIQSEDASSQTTFGKRTYPLPGKFYPSTTSAKSYTDAIVARFKDQLAVVTFRYQANQSSSHMTQALTRTVGERISVVANGTLASGAQLGIVQDFFIEAEEHSYDLSGHWVTYKLSDARTVSGYWLLSAGELGATTKLGL